ncbi:MAG TPA: hypothetical protein VHH36_02110 [Candidatus Thermoplasmatota archaeon]|nr:hypothetical protein [Candidatus Thermoplasmatota archaeon]
MAARLQRLRREAAKEAFPLAGPAFRRAAPWLLAVAALVGLATRVQPALRYAVWGSDSGEYIFLTRQLVDTGRALFDYEGWAIAYPYFPGMFAVSGAARAVLGVDLTLAVLWTVPVLAAAIPVLVGLLAYRVTHDPRVGAVAAAFSAGCSVIVITTSHAMPGTLGQILVLFVLALLPDAARDKRFLPLLLLAGFALVLTHHLSTYFAIGMVAFVAFYRELAQRHTDLRPLRVEAPFVLVTLAAAAAWWLGVAAPFREEIVGDALPIPPWATAILFALALLALPALVVAKRRSSRWIDAPRYPSFRRQWVYVLGGFAVFLASLLFMIFVRVPGTDIRIAPVTLLYAVPVLAGLAFLPLGASTIRFHVHGSVVLGALYAVLASLAFASATGSRVLFPFRHVDYMMEVMSVLVAVGAILAFDEAIASRIPAERAPLRAKLVAAMLAALAVGAVFSLPPREVIGGFEEGVQPEELALVEWTRDNLPPGTTVAADHRVSSLLFGVAGMDATWDYTPRAYHAEDAGEALDELAAARVPARGGPARVDYVFLSPPIEAGVTLLQWEQSAPMSPEAIAKFDAPGAPFERVHEEGGARLYRVKWETVGEASS